MTAVASLTNVHDVLDHTLPNQLQTPRTDFFSVSLAHQDYLLSKNHLDKAIRSTCLFSLTALYLQW